MKYISFLLNLILMSAISYGGTIAGDNTSDAVIKNLKVSGNITLTQPFSLDQPGFFVGCITNPTMNILGNFVFGNDAFSGEQADGYNNIIIGNSAGNNAYSENSILIGTHAGETADAIDSIFIGKHAGEASDIVNAICIGNYSGYNYSGEQNSQNQIFIDSLEDVTENYNATNSAIYIDDGIVNIGRGDSSGIINRLRGSWVIEDLIDENNLLLLDSTKRNIESWHTLYCRKGKHKYIIPTNFTENVIHLFINEGDSTTKPIIVFTNWVPSVTDKILISYNCPNGSNFYLGSNKISEIGVLNYNINMTFNWDVASSVWIITYDGGLESMIFDPVDDKIYTASDSEFKNYITELEW